MFGLGEGEEGIVCLFVCYMTGIGKITSKKARNRKVDRNITLLIEYLYKGHWTEINSIYIIRPGNILTTESTSSTYRQEVMYKWQDHSNINLNSFLTST